MAKTITCLPDEVIAIILGYNDITIEDVINFRCVSKQLRYAAKYNMFWQKKLLYRWHYAKKYYDELKETELKENVPKEKEYLNFMKIGISCARELRNYMSQIIFEYYLNSSTKNYNNLSINKLITFRDKFLLSEHNFFLTFYTNYTEKYIKYLLFIDEIRNMITQSPRTTYRDLIGRYFNIKRSHYMKLSSVRNELNRIVEKPKREQLLEQTCILLAQIIQPQKDVCYSGIKASLDSIAQQVLSILKEKHPNHSIFSTSAETFSYWKNNNIDDNHWDEAESTQIMDTLEEYINLNFQACDFEDMNLENLCIDNVLQNKCGQEIILLIIYHSVARRLGLRCDVIKVSKNCLNFFVYMIYWKTKYITKNIGNAQCLNTNKYFSKLSNNLFNQLYSTVFYDSGSYDITTIKATKIRDEIRQLMTYLREQHLITRWKLIEVDSNLQCSINKICTMSQY